MSNPSAATWLAPGAPGFNIERSRWLTLEYESVPLYQSAAFFKAMYAGGIRVIRGFFGTSPSNDIIGLGRAPVASDLTPYFQGLDLATQAGIRCYFDATDVLPVTDWTNSGSWVPAWIPTFGAAAAAYPFQNPELICWGPFNEPVDDGAQGATWNPIIEEACAMLRAALPNSVLSIPHNDWNSPTKFGTLPTAPDDGFVFVWHYYPLATPANGVAAVQAEWAGVASTIAGFGKPSALTEAGLFNANVGGNPGYGDWPAAITAMYAGAGSLSPLAWALTDQGDGNAPPINQTASGLGTANGTGDLPAPVAASYAALPPVVPPIVSGVPTPTPVPQVVTCSNPGTVEVGAPVTLQFTTTPPLASIGWVGVSANPANTWYGGATTLTSIALASNGTGEAIWFPIASGDFVKFGASIATSQDTEPVVIVAAPPVPVPVPVPLPTPTPVPVPPVPPSNVAALQAASAANVAAIKALADVTITLQVSDAALQAAITAGG